MDSTPWAVLVVAYRSADLLETCLTSVERYLPDAEVHVWDNSGPGHDAVRGLARRMPAVHWYLGGDNIGFAAAVNALASRVPGRDLLLLNPDAELLGPLTGTRTALLDPRVAAAAPMTSEPPLDSSRAHRPWDVAHRRRTLVNSLGEMAIAAERTRGTPLSNLYRHRPDDVDGYLTGACLAIRRDAWDSLGPFDEEFFLYGEEADWQGRAIAAGRRVRLVDEIGIRHSARGTVAGDTAASQRSWDLVTASFALQLERRRGHLVAEVFLAGCHVIAAVKALLGRRRGHGAPSDVVLTVDDARSPSTAAVVALAGRLADGGRAVTVVSMERLGTLPRDLPPSVRLLRRPWWWARTWPGDRTAVLVTGTSRREARFARLYRVGRRAAAAHADGGVDGVLRALHDVDARDLEAI